MILCMLLSFILTLGGLIAGILLKMHLNSKREHVISIASDAVTDGSAVHQILTKIMVKSINS